MEYSKMEMQKIKKFAKVGAFCLLACWLLLAYADLSFAADSAADNSGPNFESFADLANAAKTNGWRAGRGMTLCPIKLGILAIFYLAWVASVGWINNDAEKLGDPDRSKWNGINLVSFSAALILALLIPIFWVGLPLVIVGWLVPVFIYVKARNKDLLDADKVMTWGHLTFWFKTKVLKQKVKPKKLPYEGGSPVQLEAYELNIDESKKIVRTVASRDEATVGYNYFRELLYHALHARANDVVIEFGPEETKFQYQIDGVFHPITDAFRKPLLREEADELARAAKFLIGGKPNDRAGRQSGTFRIFYDKNKKGKPYVCDARLETVGTPKGEFFRVTFLFETAKFTRLDELGTSEERQAEMRRLINADKGLVVLATDPHQGLKTLTTVIFNSADRFTRDFAGVEDAQHPYEEIENIATTQYDSAKGENPMTVLPDVFFKEPKVLLIRDMVNLDSWNLCCDEVGNDRLIITTERAPDAVSTIIKILSKGVNPEKLANTLIAVITQRLVRRLCEDCKEEVVVKDPRVIKEFGLDPKNPKWFVKHIHEPVAEGERDYYIPCDECRDIGYKGRVAVFDILEINDEMRQIIAADEALDVKEAALRHKAAQSGHEGYWVDGKRLIREGVTSYDEMRRVMEPAKRRPAQKSAPRKA